MLVDISASPTKVGKQLLLIGCFYKLEALKILFEENLIDKTLCDIDAHVTLQGQSHHIVEITKRAWRDYARTLNDVNGKNHFTASTNHSVGTFECKNS